MKITKNGKRKREEESRGKNRQQKNLGKKMKIRKSRKREREEENRGKKVSRGNENRENGKIRKRGGRKIRKRLSGRKENKRK